MKNILVALTVTLAGLGFGAHAAERTVTLDVANMSCVTCPLTVKTAIKRVPGVLDATVDFKTKQAHVRFDDAKTTALAVSKASTDVGFPATVTK
jgi:mercuric ion binding protein